MTLRRASDSAIDAVRRSCLAGLRDESFAELLRDAWIVNLPRGAYWSDEARSAAPAIVVAGRLRLCLMSADGRQLVVRHVGRSGTVGFVPTPFSEICAFVEVATPTQLLKVSPRQLERVLRSEPRVAHAVATETRQQLGQMIDVLAAYAFGSMRQGVARHLLGAAELVNGHTRVTRTTHQAVADAVGSVREVAGRTLRQLAKEGVIAITRDGFELLDMERLRTIGSTRDMDRHPESIRS